MLKHTQTSASTIPVFHLTELHTEPASVTSDSLLSDASPMNERQRGMFAGETAFQHTLAEAVQRKGTPLTKGEILELYGARYQEGITAWKRGEISDDWNEGWWRGLALACQAAERVASDIAQDRQTPQSVSLTNPVVVTFRKATILVDDPDEFHKGITCGQMFHVDEHIADGKPTTWEGLFQSVVDTMRGTRDGTPKSYLVGFVLGQMDALLRDRRTYPGEWWG